MADDTVKAGQTEPIEFTLDANNIDDLDDLDTAELYVRKNGETTNHVDGVALSVKDSAAQLLQFNPDGNAADGGVAFDETGLYLIYVKATWNDNDETRHPDEGYVEREIEETWES